MADIAKNFVRDQINDANKNLLPKKSREIYEDVWQKYKNFCFEKKIEEIYEIDTVYAYLNWMHTKKEWTSPSTLWNKYSIIKSMVFNKSSIKFDNNPVEKQIAIWIKQKQVTYHTKKSDMFTKEQISNFLENGELNLIQKKIVIIVGCFSGLRSESIAKLT